MAPTTSNAGEVVTSRVLEAVFTELDAHHVIFEGMLLKPNMVIAGKKCARQENAAGCRGYDPLLITAECRRLFLESYSSPAGRVWKTPLTI
ncbi:MAG: class I fructose-bisphosphate aldolase [Desulfobacterales bacterium]